MQVQDFLSRGNSLGELAKKILEEETRKKSKSLTRALMSGIWCRICGRKRSLFLQDLLQIRKGPKKEKKVGHKAMKNNNNLEKTETFRIFCAEINLESFDILSRLELEGIQWNKIGLTNRLIALAQLVPHSPQLSIQYPIPECQLNMSKRRE